MVETLKVVMVPAVPAQWVIGFASARWRKLHVEGPPARTYHGKPIKGVWSNPSQ